MGAVPPNPSNKKFLNINSHSHSSDIKKCILEKLIAVSHSIIILSKFGLNILNSL